MTDRNVAEVLEELLEVQRQNQRWLKILAWEKMQNAVIDGLNQNWEYHLYEMLDGEHSTRDLAEELPRGSSTITRRLDRWSSIGIVEQTPSGKYDKVVSLETLGIDLPKLESEE